MGSSVLLAAAIWVSSLHCWFRRAPQELATALAAGQLRAWRDGSGGPGIAALRRSNPEWDLMARMFASLAFANRALREPARRAEYLAAIDRIIDTTVAAALRHGQGYFLLPYGQTRPFLDPGGRSLFVDGEIAMMMAARQLVERDPGRDPQPWIERLVAQLERGPALLGESYPDEVWIFCNTVALAAVRLADVSRGAPAAHAELVRRWVARARGQLVEGAGGSGLLVSSTDLIGHVQQGPEGSTLWLATDMLLLLDEAFAHEQYQRAHRALARGLAGFAWAREWPAAAPGRDDIDSGPTIPLVGANAGSSGLALVAARAFQDQAFAEGLIASLGLAGFPVDGHFAAGNQLADAVLLYALSSGPLWQRAGVATGRGGRS